METSKNRRESGNGGPVATRERYPGCSNGEYLMLNGSKQGCNICSEFAVSATWNALRSEAKMLQVLRTQLWGRERRDRRWSISHGRLNFLPPKRVMRPTSISRKSLKGWRWILQWPLTTGFGSEKMESYYTCNLGTVMHESAYPT
jgi:hypothetical protein